MSTNDKGIYYIVPADAPITEEARSLALANSVPVGPNYVINGAMDVWQRSVGPVSAGSGGYVAADRWYVYNGAVATTTVAQETSIVPPGFSSSFKLTQTGTSTTVYLMQSVETANASLLQGKTVTLSAYVYGAVNTTFAVGLRADPATDKTPATGYATNVAVSSATAVAAATWTRISATGVVPATTKTLRIDVYAISPALGQPFYFTGVQLEEGSYATPFRRSAPSIQAELAACQRYFQSCYMQGRGYGTVATVDTGAFARYTYPVRMRVSPTITQTGVSKSGSPAGYDSFFEGADAGGVSYIYRHGNASGSGGLYFTVTWTANAEL